MRAHRPPTARPPCGRTEFFSRSHGDDISDRYPPSDPPPIPNAMTPRTSHVSDTNHSSSAPCSHPARGRIRRSGSASPSPRATLAAPGQTAGESRRRAHSAAGLRWRPCAVICGADGSVRRGGRPAPVVAADRRGDVHCGRAPEQRRVVQRQFLLLLSSRPWRPRRRDGLSWPSPAAAAAAALVFAVIPACCSVAHWRSEGAGRMQRTWPCVPGVLDARTRRINAGKWETMDSISRCVNLRLCTPDCEICLPFPLTFRSCLSLLELWY